ncbi:MAG: aminotransferase class V-fold PLP-dependent enzyme, partial [Candidatus Electryoneaceae bacterium]|nr:aminotransferase class V-fold PLP-dependent enzyme [Candidatus Electryoneaceae bacterium]
MIDPIRIRSDFPIFSERNDEKPLIYLDNAASTQKPRQVIEAITDFYSRSYANIHRSPHSLGAEATEKFEAARAKVAGFIGSAETDEVIFTKGTTESLNLVAGIFAQQLLKPDDVILLTPSEHHSNLIPWQMAAKRTGAKLQFVTLHKDGQLDPDEIERNWNPRVKVFAFQHASNVLGTIHPVKELCRIAGNNGALTVIDAAQAAPHMPVNVQDLGCDFYAFSSHKMCGPTGIGALWGRRELLERFDPIFGGGEMIGKVDLYSCTYNVIPYKFEPGT